VLRGERCPLPTVSKRQRLSVLSPARPQDHCVHRAWPASGIFASRDRCVSCDHLTQPARHSRAGLKIGVQASRNRCAFRRGKAKTEGDRRSNSRVTGALRSETLWRTGQDRNENWLLIILRHPSAKPGALAMPLAQAGSRLEEPTTTRTLRRCNGRSV